MATGCRWRPLVPKLIAQFALCRPLDRARDRHLDRARHTCDLPQREEITLNLDWRHNGLGSNSCGPEPLPRYLLRPEPVSFGLRLAPLERDLNSPFDVARRRFEAATES